MAASTQALSVIHAPYMNLEVVVDAHPFDYDDDGDVDSDDADAADTGGTCRGDYGGDCRRLDADCDRDIDGDDYTTINNFVTSLSGDMELQCVPAATRSQLGNVFAHQGLPLDAEIGSYQNRARQYAPKHKRFMQRDSWVAVPRAKSGYQDGTNLYLYVAGNPIRYYDPRGRQACQNPESGQHPVNTLLDSGIDILNFFVEFDINVWSEGENCSKVDDEKRGCVLCHQRCKWQCGRILVCVEYDPPDGEARGCCGVVSIPGTICNSGWVGCILGDHILFSCEPGVHDWTLPSVIEITRCWGLKWEDFYRRLEDWIDELG